MKRFLKTADDSSQSETRTTHPSFSGRLSWLKKASWGLSVSLRILLSRCGFYNFEFDKKKKNNNPETVAHVRRATGHLHPLYSGGNRNVRRTYLNLQNVKPAILMAGWENIIFWADPLKVLWFYSCCQKYFHPPETICAGEICKRLNNLFNTLSVLTAVYRKDRIYTTGRACFPKFQSKRSLWQIL